MVQSVCQLMLMMPFVVAYHAHAALCINQMVPMMQSAFNRLYAQDVVSDHTPGG